MGGGPQRSGGLGRRRGRCRGRHPRMDRPSSVSGGRARRPERRRRTQGAGHASAWRALAQLAEADGAALGGALADLPVLYGLWIEAERKKLAGLPARRRETGERLIAEMETAKSRIAERHRHPGPRRQGADGLSLYKSRRRHGRSSPPRGATGDPNALPEPQWRPFQLAFVLLNLAGLVDRTHVDRETADLLFFPTGGGKTEAYLGLAAFVIAHRRLSGSGVLGAGVAVIMRYTLRLLTLDQLARAAGVVCALELMRTDPKNVDEQGRRLLGDWPIEIGLWVGSDASPNMLGGKRKVRRDHGRRAGAALSQWTRQARAGAAQGLPVVRNGVHAVVVRVHAERACADQSRNPLRQHRLRFQPQPAAADPYRRRADLSASAGVSDRYGRQVRGSALGGRDRRLLWTCRSLRRRRRLLRGR